MAYRFSKKDIKKMTEKGWGITMIAEHLGCHSTTLRNWAKEEGFVFPKQRGVNKVKRIPAAQDCRVTKGFTINSVLLRQAWA